ncbi:RagB/SusD family nutrient uptake outer membrane protein [Fulvivirga lutimaris]|uniref:RagB/SusD family nutrient uptake outer membrane protein n=1 Tax=Fulvivirga lutimaris TaxID=1819566 RepID=UPI0012BB7023|nr:RagB/SusD family nutrient uptake outer membrane protein [Fulvivirga lutimaris]MTI39859.1 RagB/SusD family nutrient uptake outer membrane protein [Fulvivirga lutimaris]
MTRILTYYQNAKKFALAALLLVVGSCNDFLDEVPDNRVALNDLDKAAQLLTNAYSTASPAFTDWMSDNVSWTRGTTIRPGQELLYKWEDDLSDPTEPDSPTSFWFQTYDAIAHANEVLAVINDLPASTDEEIKRKRAIEGEALLTRAYGHFMLVNLFAEHFQFQGSSLGIPYVSEPETEFLVSYERASVKRVYDKVEDDLLDGLKLINDSFFANSGKYHFNKNAALAFASRFYLFKNDFTRCLQYSNELLGADPSAFVRDMTSEEFQLAKSSISAYPQLYSSPDLQSNLMLMRKISLIQRPDFAFGPSTSFYGSLFATRPFASSTDERENPALVKGDNATFPLRYEGLFERSSINSNSGLPYHIAIAFRGEEVLLNRAEANTYLGDTGLAIADLQVLSERRYSGSDINLTMELLRQFFGAENDPSFSDQDILLNYIILERRKEFIGQGMRWFDLKRYGVPVVHDLLDGSTISLDGDDERKALQIPQSAIDVGGLEPNPR